MPIGFPAGCLLYGENQKCASLPKWAASLFKELTQDDSTDQTQGDPTEQTWSNPTEQIDIMEQTSDLCEPQLPVSKIPRVDNCLSRAASASDDAPLLITRKTRTRNIVFSVRYRDQPRCADN